MTEEEKLWQKIDSKAIRQIAKDYANGNEEIEKAFIDGYKQSIINPFLFTIKMIVIYTLDYVPKHYQRKLNMNYITKCVREIFRMKLCPNVEKYLEEV